MSLSAPQNLRKPNQDALLMKHCQPSSSLVIACFDGHGLYGHLISRFCKSYMEMELPLHKSFETNLSAAIIDVTQALGKRAPATCSDALTRTCIT